MATRCSRVPVAGVGHLGAGHRRPRRPGTRTGARPGRGSRTRCTGSACARSAVVRLRSTPWRTAKVASALEKWSRLLGGGGPLVGAGVTVGGHLLQAGEVVAPALGVHGCLLLGQSLVDQGHQGAALGGLDRHGDGGGVGRQVGAALPSPAEDDAPAGLDLAVGARGDVAGRDRPAVLAAGAQVDPRGDGLPAAQPLGLGDQGERLVRRDRQHGCLGVAHGLLLRVWASATSWSSSSVQKRSISACSLRRPPGSTR